MKCEHHTEFVSLTIIVRDSAQIDPDSFVLHNQPIFLSLLIGIEAASQSVLTNSEKFRWSNKKSVSKSNVHGGLTTIASNFSLDERGSIRVLITTSVEDPNQLGRLAQRLIEIESYGTLSFLAWETVVCTGPLLQRPISS